MPPRTTCLDKRDVRHPRLVVVLWRERPSQTSKSASCFGTTPRRLPRQGGTHTSLDKRDVRHPRASAHPSSSTSPRGSNGEITDSNSPPNGTSGTIGLQGIDVPAQGLASAAHVGQRVTRWNSSISLPPNGQTRCTAPSSTSCSAATIADIEIGTVLRHNHRRLPLLRAPRARAVCQGGARGKLYRLFFHIGMYGTLVD